MPTMTIDGHKVTADLATLKALLSEQTEQPAIPEGDEFAPVMYLTDESTSLTAAPKVPLVATKPVPVEQVAAPKEQQVRRALWRVTQAAIEDAHANLTEPGEAEAEEKNLRGAYRIACADQGFSTKKRPYRTTTRVDLAREITKEALASLV